MRFHDYHLNTRFDIVELNCAQPSQRPPHLRPGPRDIEASEGPFAFYPRYDGCSPVVNKTPEGTRIRDGLVAAYDGSRGHGRCAMRVYRRVLEPYGLRQKSARERERRSEGRRERRRDEETSEGGRGGEMREEGPSEGDRVQRRRFPRTRLRLR